MKQPKGFTIVEGLLIVLVIGVVGFAGYYVSNQKEDQATVSDSIVQQEQSEQQDTKKNSESKNETASILEGSFSKNGDDFTGNFEAIGYATEVQTDEAFCEQNCKKDNVVVFNISEIKNPNFVKFADMYQGNSFVSKTTINIGCQIDGTITGRQAFTNEDSQKILSSTQSKPVILDFNRTTVPQGRGVDNCHSHFDRITIVE